MWNGVQDSRESSLLPVYVLVLVGAQHYARFVYLKLWQTRVSTLELQKTICGYPQAICAFLGLVSIEGNQPQEHTSQKEMGHEIEFMVRYKEKDRQSSL